ncbi:MAG: molecular chaperone TorD family protein [Lentisphaerae bacterium]|nr:molecular chaperone TorD family protein [Lentisphaerota bacterium]
MNTGLLAEEIRPPAAGLETSTAGDRARMAAYRTFAAAFAYPDETFFAHFPALAAERCALAAEYDRLFRAGEAWLYGAEYTAQHEFQRVQLLADISAFYRAFAVQAEGDRPDALANELAFMHYLIFKRLRAVARGETPEGAKAAVCREAEKKFFSEHLSVPAQKIAEKILTLAPSGFYAEISRELLAFLESEREFFGHSP